MITLYKQDVTGKMRFWEIEENDNVLVMSYGEMGGAVQFKKEVIRTGLGGRTLSEQVHSRYLSRINEQYKKGYKASQEAARASVGTNAMGLARPMLAQPLKKVRGLDFQNAYIQHKYDGHRCLITNINGQNMAYSRQGKPINSIDHILEEMDIPEGSTIDGELYCHGVSLQTITSWVKREQEATINLKYHAYDQISNLPFAERFTQLSEMMLVPKHSLIVPTMSIQSEEDVSRMFRTAKLNGYEGSIVRWGNVGYEVGKRSKHLVKIKEFQDQEFMVIDILASKDNWGVLECALEGGKSFRVTAPGSQMEKTEVLENKENYINRYVTVEYANLTKDGIPFHPVAVRWRGDI